MPRKREHIDSKTKETKYTCNMCGMDFVEHAGHPRIHPAILRSKDPVEKLLGQLAASLLVKDPSGMESHLRGSLLAELENEHGVRFTDGVDLLTQVRAEWSTQYKPTATRELPARE